MPNVRAAPHGPALGQQQEGHHSPHAAPLAPLYSRAAEVEGVPSVPWGAGGSSRAGCKPRGAGSGSLQTEFSSGLTGAAMAGRGGAGGTSGKAASS